MLENLVGKKVFVLISTRSGVSNSIGNYGSESTLNGICKVTGIFKGFDDKYIVISDATNYYMNIFDEVSLKSKISPYSLVSNNSYIRQDNIIFIAEV